MLSIGKLSAGADSAAYYLEVIANGRDDYYLAADEVPGRWTGSAAARLGLAGVVEREDLEAVLAGTDPRTGERIARWRSVAGFDLTLSAPKSVSLLWGLGDPEVAGSVVAAHEAAASAALAYLEDEACSVRRGHGGFDQVGGAGFVAAAFRHRTSRANDPNLHTHLVTANMTLGTDGRWSSLDGSDLYRHGRTAGFVYQAVLRHEVAERLSVGFEPAGPGVGEVLGVPEQVRRAFSRRRQAVEASMHAHGSHSAHGAQVAVLDTRQAKSRTVGEEEQRRDWRARADEAGFVLYEVPRRRTQERAVSGAALGRLLTEHDATFDHRAVIRVVAESAAQGFPYGEIRRRAEALLVSPNVMEVAPGRWTTPEMLALEADALSRACGGGPTRAVPGALAAAAVDARPTISSEQREAVMRITTSDEPVAVLVGRAGTGKTFALDAARAAWQSAGLRPVGAALAARAAKELQSGSGIPSSTVSALLADVDRGERTLTARDVVVVDEAGMVGTRDLHRLICATTDAGAKLVLVGDPKQIAEIEAGGLFGLLGQRLGAVELTENRRMRDPDQRAVADAIRHRRIDEVLRRLDQAAALTVDDNADRLRRSMARDWFHERRNGRDAVMLALHRSDVGDLNDRARALRAAAGELGPSVYRDDDIELRVGDEVLALRNDRSIGVLNGTRGTIRDAGARGVEIETDDGTCLDIPPTYMAQRQLTLAYATTVHKAQGMTCDVSLVLGDDSLYAEAGYTSLTRGRLRNHVYAVAAPDPDEAGLPLRRALARSAAKQTAHEMGGDAHEPPGLGL